MFSSHEEFLKKLQHSVFGPTRAKSEPGSPRREAHGPDANKPEGMPRSTALWRRLIRIVDEHMPILEHEHRPFAQELRDQFEALAQENE